MTKKEYHSPHNRERKSLNLHDAHRLVVEVSHVEVLPHQRTKTADRLGLAEAERRSGVDGESVNELQR